MAYLINQDNYFDMVQPAKSEELLNSVEVAHYPLQQQDFNDEYYKTMEAIPIPYLSTIDIECVYSEPPCLNPAATAYETNSEGEITYDDTTGLISNDTLTVNTITYYAWGVVLNVTNNNAQATTTSTTSTTLNPEKAEGYCVVVVTAIPLKSQGLEGYTAKDTSSILENGVLKYSYPKNHLIQHRENAVDIATTLLATYVIPRKDISLDWRGDPSLELTDEVDVPEYNKNGIYTEGTFSIFKQIIKYDGTLKAKLEGRKVPETTTTTGAP